MADIYIEYLPKTGNEMFDLKAQALVDLLRSYVSNHDTRILALESSVSTVTWTAVTSFSNSWVNFGDPWYDAGYCKDAFGFVHIRGTLKNGTWNAAAFSLPAGFRPVGDHMEFVSLGYNYVPAKIKVSTDGDVVIQGAAASNDWVLLDGINFHVG